MLIKSSVIIGIAIAMVLLGSSQIASSATPNDLPICDGSFQDCVRKKPSGFVCLGGSKKAECECSYDMSTCLNHPEYDRIVQQHQDIVLMEERDEKLGRDTPPFNESIGTVSGGVIESQRSVGRTIIQ